LSARTSFRTPEGKQFLRPVTVMTLVQIAASVMLPAVAGAVGADEWAIPIVAVTIGLFLVSLARSVGVRAVCYVGIEATIVSLALPFLARGDTLVALTSANMMVALTVSAIGCARVAAGDRGRRNESISQSVHTWATGLKSPMGSMSAPLPHTFEKEHRGLPS